MRRSRGLRPLALVGAVLALVLFAPAPAGAQAQTVVSLTFDDGWADQYSVRSLFESHRMDATFYVNTNRIGAQGYLSWAQLEALNADGHEVAGHSLDHADLTTVSTTEARRQVCDDRSNLLSRGFIAESFAYPYGEYDSTTKTIVGECGYASGRAAWGLRNVTSTTDTRPYAESIPPLDRYAIRTPCCIGSNTTLASLQNYITQAENNGGGWVPLVLHRICDNCGADTPAPSMSPATLGALLDWLEPRTTRGTVVRTVAQVISGDSQPPTSSISCNGASCAAGSYTSPVTVALGANDAGSGVAHIRYTLDGSEPTVSSSTYSGPFTVATTTTVRYRAWDDAGNVEGAKSQLIQVETDPNVDTVPPTSSIACDASACSSGWYRASVTVTLSATDDRSGVAAIRYTLDGSEPTVSSPAYIGPFTISATTNVRYRAWDNAGNVETTRSQFVQIDGAGPSVAVASPSDGATVRGVVKIAANATDPVSGVATVSFYANGVLIGTKTGAPFTINWNTRKLTPGQYTLTAAAADVAGNTSTSPPITVTVTS